jgi:hypothetical protein
MARKRVKTPLQSVNSSRNDAQKQPYPPLPLKETAQLAAEIVETIAGVVPGKPSNIKDKELLECATASRIALCWHLASIRDSARRYSRLRGLRRSVGKCMVAVEDVGLAVIRPTSFFTASGDLLESGANSRISTKVQKLRRKTTGRTWRCAANRWKAQFPW